MTSAKHLRMACTTLLLQTASAFAAQPVWHSGFEQGFPGKAWLAFDDGSHAADEVGRPDRSSAWTIIHRKSGEPVFSGEHAYKGWVAKAAADNHRAYPVIHVDLPTPLVNTFMVYLDADYSRMASSDWIQLGTWGNHDPTAQSGKWALHTMSIRGRRLEFAHTNPFSGNYIGPAARAEFPLRRWVRITVYIHYEGDNGFVQTWQDGTPMLSAQVPQLKQYPGTRLKTAHWGMYASGTLDHGTQYNDDIRICTLQKPLTDFQREPVCPAGRGR